MHNYCKIQNDPGTISGISQLFTVLVHIHRIAQSQNSVSLYLLVETFWNLAALNNFLTVTGLLTST